MSLAMNSLMSNLDRKERALRARLASLRSLMVAYSGGTDSAYLAWAAHQVLGERMTAVLADSPSLPRHELKLAMEFAERWGIPLKVIATDEMSRPEYTRNDSSRCFHCKDELFSVMEEQRKSLSFQHIAYGKNLDDQGDWDKPASACLSSRIEYGRPVTRDALAVIEAGEEALRELGFRQARVRHHGEIVRIEIAREELDRAFSPEMAQQLVPIFKNLGFKYVTMDCEGYRSGSLNAVLPIEQIRMTG